MSTFDEGDSDDFEEIHQYDLEYERRELDYEHERQLRLSEIYTFDDLDDDAKDKVRADVIGFDPGREYDGSENEKIDTYIRSHTTWVFDYYGRRID